jgi:hypothetical protein
MSIKKLNRELLEWYKEDKLLTEATGTSGSGSFKVPLSPGTRLWDKTTLDPFNIQVSKYDDAELAYDSYDGSLDVSKKNVKKMESKARKIEKYQKKHPENSDDDGNNLNGGNGPGTPVGPFNKIVKEDLAVWFGTKKKPKGSKQPKGPWVNICRNKEGGGHPPCGRPDASDKGYPKCRAAGVASKMTDSQKRSACQQKRKAEKTHSKSGTGNAPKMTHYEPKKESVRDNILNVIKEYLSR